MRSSRPCLRRHVRTRVGQTLIALLATAAFTTPARAQVLREEFWVPDGNVLDVAVGNGDVYLAGDFTQVGPATGGFVGLDRSTGATLQPFPEVQGTVFAMADDGAGGWYIGGYFTAVQGQPRRHLAHLDAAGHLTAWGPAADKAVSCLLRDPPTGIVYAGGHFDSIGGQRRGSLAAIGPDGPVTSWNADLWEYAAAVQALALSGGVLYAGGRFEHLHRTFAVFAEPATAAASVGCAPLAAHLRASPNPFRSRVTLVLALPRAGDLEIVIHDLAGRRVRRLAGGAHASGEHRVAWDGRDDDGRGVRAGVCFARVESESMRATTKVLLLEQGSSHRRDFAHSPLDVAGQCRHIARRLAGPGHASASRAGPAAGTDTRTEAPPWPRSPRSCSRCRVTPTRRARCSGATRTSWASSCGTIIAGWLRCAISPAVRACSGSWAARSRGPLATPCRWARRSTSIRTARARSPRACRVTSGATWITPASRRRASSIAW